MPSSSITAPRKPLKKRSGPIKAKGKKGSRFPHRRNKAYTDWVASHVCILASRGHCWHPVEEIERGRLSDPAHVRKTRGAGADDEGEVVNLCRQHHREQEGRTAYFDAKYRVDLILNAEVLWRKYQRRVGSGSYHPLTPEGD